MSDPIVGTTWTVERRQRQREAIQRWKPWQQATGPKSVEGKATSARNAYKGGHTVKLRQMIAELNGLLQDQRRCVIGTNECLLDDQQVGKITVKNF